MRFHTLILAILAATLTPTCLLAQQEGTHSDRYSTVMLGQDTIRTAGGGMILEERFIVSQFADQEGSPMDKITGHCWGSVIFQGGEIAVAAGGVCHMMDPEGNGYFSSYSWEKASTEDCPIRCGSYRDFNGYGKFEGMTGNGRWNLTAELPGMSVMGRHQGTYVWK